MAAKKPTPALLPAQSASVRDFTLAERAEGERRNNPPCRGGSQLAGPACKEFPRGKCQALCHPA